jgi:hypothetical protein
MSQPTPPRQTFLQRAPIRKFLRRALSNWLERHQHPFNRGIHFIGIPMSLAGVVLLFTLAWQQWYWGVAAFVGGYVLQWLGHRVEGNDLGEWAAIKRMLGRPYVAVAPPRRDETASEAR